MVGISERGPRPKWRAVLTVRVERPLSAGCPRERMNGGVEAVVAPFSSGLPRLDAGYMDESLSPR